LGGGLRCLLSDLDEVVVGRAETRDVRAVRARRLNIALPDRKLSAKHARFVRHEDTWHIEDLGSTNGTFVNGRRVTREELADGDVVVVGRAVLLMRLFLPTPEPAPSILFGRKAAGQPFGIVTLLPALAAELAPLGRVAKSNVTVLLLGETGTGKEVCARAIHAASQRRGELVPVNCAALPDSLVEAQFFGHHKGAFTGAAREALGFVRAADGGTLFLDEIGDLPPSAQGVLLRVLQEGEVVPIGSARPIRVDVRVIAATHRPIEAMVDRGAFRHDLFARLQGFTQRLWPLRDRREDIGLLLADILRDDPKHSSEPVRITSDAACALVRHKWPLNVRELKQALLGAYSMVSEGRLTLEHLPPAVAQAAAAASPSKQGRKGLSPADAALRATLTKHLQNCRGNVAAVARDMGKATMQVYRWMERLGIDPRTFR
jgi:DNA-binding NtrC family response regulator